MAMSASKLPVCHRPEAAKTRGIQFWKYLKANCTNIEDMLRFSAS